MTYKSEIDRRANEAEERYQAMDPHGEIITDGDLRAWEKHLKNIAEFEDVKTKSKGE